MYRSTAVTLLLGGALAGCTVGPNYARPAVEAPAAWRTPSETTGSLADMTWWALFQDPVLQRLVATALEEKDLRTLQATHESRPVKTQALA